MRYLIDANVLIDAARDYYPIEMVPEFWEWLVHQGELGNIKIPVEIFEEVSNGNDLLANWLSTGEVKAALLLEEEADADIVSVVVAEGYAPDLNDAELIKVGRDPFLIAYALAGGECSVVTTESSKPSCKRANRHVPDVCDTLGVNCINTFELTKILGFRTSWRK